MKNFLFLCIMITCIPHCFGNATSINLIENIQIGGIQQVISIKGKDTSKPILLYLHGGPGVSVMDKADKFSNKLQDYFIVVQWDQRETGKTLKLNNSPAPLSTDLMKNDTKEMIDYLLKKFSREKLYLAGESWGAVLGFHIAGNFPELLHAFMAVSPHIYSKKGYIISLDYAKMYANNTNNYTAMKELEKVQIPPKNIDQRIYFYRWVSASVGEQIADSQVKEARPSFIAHDSTWGKINTDIDNINMYQTQTIFKCPVYFFISRKDYQTPFSIAEDYFKKMKAPKKKIFWFEKSTHVIRKDEPELMQQKIIKEVLPETLSSY